MLRAGWLLAPVLAFPGKVLRYLFGTRFSTYMTIAGITILIGMASCAKTVSVRGSVATPEQIRLALENNPCMINLMPRRQAEFARPLTNGDLDRGIYDCNEFNDAQLKIAQQKQTMEALQKK